MDLIRQLLACLLVARSIAAFLPPPSATHLPTTHGVKGQLSQPIRGSSSLRSARYPCYVACMSSRAERVWMMRRFLITALLDFVQ